MQEHLLISSSNQRYDGIKSKINFFDLNKRENHELIKTFDPHEARFTSIALHPLDRNILACATNKKIVIFNISTYECIQTIDINEISIESIAFSPFHKNILACAYTQQDSFMNASSDMVPYDRPTIKIFNALTGKKLKSLDHHTHKINSIAFSPLKKNIFASAYGDKTVKIWDISINGPYYNDECIKTLTGHYCEVNCVAFSPFYENIIASASSDGAIKIWDISKPKGKECIITITDEKYAFHSVIFSPFYQHIIASTSGDRTIRIWDISKPKGKNLLRTFKHKYINSIAFSLSDKNILAATDDNIRIWDISKPENKPKKKTFFNFLAKKDPDQRCVQVLEDICCTLLAFVPKINIKTYEQEKFKEKLLEKTDPKKRRYCDVKIELTD